MEFDIYTNENNEITKAEKEALLSALRGLYRAESKISSKASSLKSWIKLVTYNQIKIMMGNNLIKIIKNIDEKNDVDSRYIDSVLCAYYKNITEGLYINNKFYKMKENQEIISSLTESKKRKLVK